MNPIWARRLPWFYSPLDETADRVQLAVDESRHLSASRRLQAGNEVCLFNGEGRIARARVLGAGGERQDQLLIEERFDMDTSNRNRFHLYCALPKKDRLATLLDMVTQIGIASFTPLRCEFSVNRLRSPYVNRWSRIMREACKQSHQGFLPELRQERLFFDQLTRLEGLMEPVIMAQPDQTSHSMLTLNKLLRSSSAVHILVGPEAGFSDRELARAETVTKIILNTGILRIETAAVCVLSQLTLWSGTGETGFRN